jgi:hypothetical protein
VKMGYLYSAWSPWFIIIFPIEMAIARRYLAGKSCYITHFWTSQHIMMYMIISLYINISIIY